MNLSAEQKSEQTLFKKTKSFFTFQFRKRKVRSHPRIPFGLALRYSLRLQNGYAASATLFAETAYVQMRCWICFNSNQKKKKKNQDHFFDTWKNFRQFFFFFFFLLPKSEIFDEFSAWTVQEKPVVRSIKEGEQTLFFFFLFSHRERPISYCCVQQHARCKLSAQLVIVTQYGHCSLPNKQSNLLRILFPFASHQSTMTVRKQNLWPVPESSFLQNVAQKQRGKLVGIRIVSGFCWPHSASATNDTSTQTPSRTIECKQRIRKSELL